MFYRTSIQESLDKTIQNGLYQGGHGYGINITIFIDLTSWKKKMLSHRMFLGDIQTNTDSSIALILYPLAKQC